MHDDIKYAGFWVRVLAALIDGLVLILPIQLIETLLGRDSWIGIIFVILLWWQYTAQMLSSSWKATIGKKILGLEVLDTEHERLTFQKASIRFLYSFVSYLFILPILMMLFNEKKQTFHDYFGKTIVVDKIAVNIRQQQYSDDVIKEGKKRATIRFIRGIGIFITIVAFAISLYYFAMFAFVFGTIYTGKQKAYESSFHIHYDTNDFNDSRILYYQKELEKYSKAFIEAESMYDIFAADTQKDLALNCIEAALKEHNVSNWLEMGSSFRKNARNKYAATEALIEKAKKNENHMGEYFYYYDMNDVNHIEDEIANIWETNKNKDTCNQKMPVLQMYDRFMVKYLENREKAIKNLKFFNIGDKKSRKKHIEEINGWIKILSHERPTALKELRVMQENEREKKAILKKEKEEREYQEKIKALWRLESGDYSGIDANIRNEKGQTPLMLAMQQEKYNFIGSLSSAIVDVWAKDNQGKTAFDYIKKPKNRHEAIFTDRAYGSLRILAIKQIIRDKARIVELRASNRADIYIKISGASCDEFVFPDYVKCRTNDRE